MKTINLHLIYKADDKYDNKLFEGLLEIQKCVENIDDLFIEHVCISPAVEDEDE